MFRLYLSSKSGSQDITQLVQQVSWSGDKANITRTVTASLLHREDGIWPIPEVGNGVALGDEEGKLFTGYVVRRNLDSERSLLSVTCYDKGMYLRGNDGTYKFKGTPAEGICRTVCADKGVPVASLAATGVALDRKFSGDKLDRIISTAYTLASERTGKRYAIRMTPEGLLVKEKGRSGESVNLRPKSNLIRASTTESIVSMVNSVALYSEDGTLLRVMNDTGAAALYGTLQRHLKQRAGEDLSAQAQALLEDGGLDRSVTVEVLGDRRLITGETVVASEPVTGLEGVFWIDSDKHVWQRGQYTCTLSLNCRSVMTKTNAGSELK